MVRDVRVIFSKELLVIVLAFVVVSCGQRTKAEQYLEEGVKYFEQGQYDKAIELYQYGIELAPKSAPGYNLLGMAYRFKYNQTGDEQWREKEIQSFLKSIDSDSNFVPALINLGATYYYSGEKERSVRYLEHALELYPEHPEAAEIRKMIAESEKK